MTSTPQLVAPVTVWPKPTFCNLDFFLWHSSHYLKAIGLQLPLYWFVVPYSAPLLAKTAASIRWWLVRRSHCVKVSVMISSSSTTGHNECPAERLQTSDNCYDCCGVITLLQLLDEVLTKDRITSKYLCPHSTDVYVTILTKRFLQQLLQPALCAK